MIADYVLEEGAKAPSLAHGYDAGYDLYAREGAEVPPYGSAVFDTGVRIAIPVHMAGFVKSRSGLYINHSITAEGVVDPGYTGTIRVKLVNHCGCAYRVEKHDKIAQLCFVRVYRPTLMRVDALAETERGDGGFGSTGR